MATGAQTGMTEEQAIAALRSRPPEAQKALLAKMDPTTKNRVLVKLQMGSSTAKPTAQQRYDADATSVMATPDVKTKIKHAIDHGLDALPTVTGTIGSIAGGSKALPTGVGLAALTGGAGEAARQFLGNLLYTDPERREALPTADKGYVDYLEKAYGDVAKEGALQGAGELGGRAAGGVVNKVIEKSGIGKAAASQIAAEAGSGVQKTPGEATGNAFQQAMEKFLSHVPGAMNPMARFTEKRGAQAATQESANAALAESKLAADLDAIGKSGMSREQQGTAVLSKVKEHSDRQAAGVYDPVKQLLGLPKDARKDVMDAAAEEAAKPRGGKILGPDGKPVVVPGDGGKALAALKHADREFATAAERNALELIEKVGKPEAAHAYLAKASLRDVRQIMPTLPPELRQGIGRSVLEDALNAGRDPLTGRYNVKAITKQLDALDRDGPKTALLFGKQAATVRETLKEIDALQKASAATKKAVGADIPMGHYKGAHAAWDFAQNAAGMGMTAATGGLSMIPTRVFAEAVTNPKTALNTLVWLRRAAQAGTRVAPPLAEDLFDPHRAPVVPLPAAR